ncbi:MAG TPA: YceI family protein [Thermodesulfobacteriota bacterium]|jgi:polyisoprenoid-binding protein YceI|nr:YceI family protein [Thermodesulfobacteriota bacterium]
MKHCFTTLLAWLVLTIPVIADAATWQIDPDHSSFQFKVRHLTVSNVKGDFNKAKGVVTFDDQDITKMTVELTIDAASVNTGNVKRDEHLKGPDFFDVTQYPTITFTSKRVTRAGTKKLKVIGNLTIHGTTKEIAVDVEGPTPEVKDPWGNFRCGATATANINRMDFGLTWNKALDSGGLVVGEEVNIYIEVELVRK